MIRPRGSTARLRFWRRAKNRAEIVRLEAGAADQCTPDIGQRQNFTSIRGLYRSPIKYAHRPALFAEALHQALSDVGMHGRNVLLRCRLAGADRPHWLIRYDSICSGGSIRHAAGQLTLADSKMAAGVSFRLGLADANDRQQSR